MLSTFFIIRKIVNESGGLIVVRVEVKDKLPIRRVFVATFSLSAN